MNWDQIESQWAAMTRRVRADWPTDSTGPEARPNDGQPVILAEGQTGNATDERLTLTVE